MKYKARVIFTSVVAATFLIYVILFAELSAYEGPKECPLRKNETKDVIPIKFKRNITREIPDDTSKHVDQDNKQDKSKPPAKPLMYNQDVERLLDTIDHLSSFGYNREELREAKFTDMASELGRTFKLKSKLLLQWGSHEHSEEGDDNFVMFHHNIRAGALYNPEDRHIDGLLHDMATDKIKSIEVIPEGTEFKLLMRFWKGTKSIFKPM
ncbi:uncharacterized protein LOC132740607, partial [Ruditapes philippinarum]|uniref:uncharacterized protein LOC132740607 n=1 Tax=Ruditapes philippinarum TaxID=129788 RepID=UPI00295B0A83